MDAKSLATDLRNRVRSLRPIPAPPIRGMDTAPPEARRMIELFAGEWASRLPAPYDDVPTGPNDLFDDERLHWAFDRIGGVEGRTVLELGPLEGGHSRMALQAGAASVLAIEANRRAFLRCLIVKELYGLDRAAFRLGDFMPYLASADESFDVGLAVGVLYHMVDPVGLIALLAKRVEKLVVWTQYFDADIVAAHWSLRRRIRESQPAEHEGFEHTLHRHDYGRSIVGASFLGGNQQHSNWLSKADLLGALEHFGFTDVEVMADEPHFSNGPAITLVATRAR